MSVGDEENTCSQKGKSKNLVVDDVDDDDDGDDKNADDNNNSPRTTINTCVTAIAPMGVSGRHQLS